MARACSSHQRKASHDLRRANLFFPKQQQFGRSYPRRRAGSENDDAEIELVTGRWRVICVDSKRL